MSLKMKREEREISLSSPKASSLISKSSQLLIFILTGLILTKSLAADLIASPTTSGHKKLAQTSEKTEKNLSSNQLSKERSQELRGIDISHYQNQIDWNQLTNSDLRFMYFKASQGISYIDSMFASNATNANQIGVPFGAYHFFDANKDPMQQANNYLQQISNVQWHLRPVIDAETLNKEPPSTLAERMKLWIDQVEKNTSCDVIIYTSENFWHKYLAKDFAHTTLWLADYTEKAPDDRWTLWQRSQDGRILGINGHIDIDILRSHSNNLESIICKEQ
ncbi:glycoside hydrolase family 25 protein [Pleionea litopenaei]|uniref:GH25 family lysozyme n=1 Tax=Pleionea litopenaei TaxID=3070815 RepID=A0AA51RSP2_9GAMM|nr:GH25 family lysozyme [Pleionea sp. HL-JVS1]WMS86788.1 GH25 family lysozyme [Pleionea sp. HL-JVS1]